MQRFWMRDHVYACIAGDIVLMDTKKDKYLRVDRSKNHLLARLIHGWPDPGYGGISPEATSDELDAVAALLLSKGLITSEFSNGKRATMPSIEYPMEEVALDMTGWRVGVSWHHVARVVVYLISSHMLIRNQRVDRAIALLRDTAADRSTDACDRRTLWPLVFVYRQIRLWLFSSNRKCLLDSLIMTRFLRAYGVNVSLVFGVSVRPFAAHCWVQQGTTVINGDCEFVRRFTPILVA